MNAVETLPQAFFLLAPELVRQGYPDEKLSTCATCPMERDDPVTLRPRFSGGSRCCTYAPTIVNFSVGRILRDGGEGAERVRGLLRTGQPSAEALKPSLRLEEAYDQRATDDFGRSRDLRCPYFQEGEFGCSIWSNRNHVCRTWYCRHVDGVRGLAFWTGVARVLERVEHLLAAFCVAEGKPPTGRPKAKQWERWYLECAQRIDRLELVDLQRLEDDEELEKRKLYLAEKREALQAPIPEVLGASVKAFDPVDEDVVFTGYSPFQPARVPKRIWAFLGALDGRPWRQVLAEAPGVTEADVINLFRVGALVEWGTVHDLAFVPGSTTSSSE